MHAENTLKVKQNSQQKTNTSRLVTKIKAILKTPIHKLEKTIFLFSKTQEASSRNGKILASFNGDLGASIAAKKDSPLNYGSEFCNTAALKKMFFYLEDRLNIINIIQQVSRYHLDPIEEETRKLDLDEMILSGNQKSSH